MTDVVRYEPGTAMLPETRDRPPVRFLTYLHAWNLAQGQSTPQHHRNMALWLETAWLSGKKRLLLLAFRGAGKSTIVGLFCAWLLTIRPDMRVLTLSADEALARRMLRTARKVIERHALSVGVRPRVPDQWAADRFSVADSPHSRDASMLAAGLESNITGARADMIICDDVEVPKTCDTPGKRRKLRERLSELEFILTPDGTQLYVGTPHAWESIYGACRAGLDASPDTGTTGAAFLQGFHRFELPLVDGAGRSAWPERYGSAHIDSLRERAGPLRFASQMMLQPADLTEARLDPAMLRLYTDDLSMGTANGEARLFAGKTRLVSASCWWDPAYGGTAARDRSVIACVFSDADGHSRIHEVAYLDTASPNSGDDPATAQCRQVAQFLERNHLSSVNVESNGVGRFLPGLLRKTLGSCPISVVERHTREAKTSRILRAFDARLSAGYLFAHAEILNGPFAEEMRSWRADSGNDSSIADDGLDAVAGCLLSEPVRLRQSPFRVSQSMHWANTNRIHRVEFDA